MAGIFNLFGNTSDINKGETTKILAGSKMTLGMPGVTGKTTNLVKTKGLSIRSTSDLNIPSTPRFGDNKLGSTSKQPDYLKPKITQLDSFGKPISPKGKKISAKKHNIEQTLVKECSVHKSPSVKSTKVHKHSDNTVFKKPFTPKKSIYQPVYPGKENLAAYYDFENSFEDLNLIPMQSQFAHLLKLNEDLPLQEYESDPEVLTCPELPTLNLPSFCSDGEYEQISFPDLPELSDLDDDF